MQVQRHYRIWVLTIIDCFLLASLIRLGKICASVENYA
jgi:hypothetical protein